MNENIKFVVGSYNPGNLSTNQQQELIQNLLKMGEGDDNTTITIDDIVSNFGIAKTDISFFDQLHTVLKKNYPNSHIRNKVMSNAITTIKENELYTHLSMITNSEITPYHSLQHVKKYIGEYYEMIYKFVEREALKDTKDQLHSIEDAFNRTDPLFWVALFLYQKELNITTKFLTNINTEISQKRKLMKFLQDDDTIDILGDEKKFKTALRERYMLTFNIEPKHIDQFRGLEAIDAVATGELLEKEIKWKSDIASTLGKEHSPFEKFFEYTREYANSLNTNNAIIKEIRDNLRSMARKFNTRQLNPLKEHINYSKQLQTLLDFIIQNKNKTIRQPAYTAFKNKHEITLNEYDTYFINGEAVKTVLSKAVEGDLKIIAADKGLQDILSQEFQFMQTMTWFGQNKYAPFFVRNINLAGHNIGIPRASTLKGRLDKICGTLKERRTKFTFTTPSMKTTQLLLTNSEQSGDTNNDLDISPDVKEAADELFNNLLSDEI